MPSMRLSWQEFSTPWATYYVLQLDFLGKFGSRQPSIVTGRPMFYSEEHRQAADFCFTEARKWLSFCESAEACQSLAAA